MIPIADTRDPPPDPILAYLCRLAGVTGRVALRPYITLSESEHACGAPYRGCIAVQSSGLGAGVLMLNKQWFPERFAEVAAHLLEHHPVVQVGLPDRPPGPLHLRPARQDLTPRARRRPGALPHVHRARGHAHAHGQGRRLSVGHRLRRKGATGPDRIFM